MADNPEREAVFERARGALAEYRQTDQRTQLGALPLERCEYLIAGTVPGAEGLSVDNQRDLAWLHFEHAIAMHMSCPPGVKEAIRRKDAQLEVEKSRRMFRHVMNNPHASGATRARASLELASLPLYEGFCTRKLMINPGARRSHTETMYDIASHYEDYFGPEDAHEAHMLIAMALIGDLWLGKQAPILLAAPTRVDWDINVYDDHRSPPRHICVSDGSKAAPPGSFVILHPQLQARFSDKEEFGSYPSLGAYAECRRNYNIQHSSKQTKYSSAYSALLRFQELYPPLYDVAEPLRTGLLSSPIPEVFTPKVIDPEVEIEQRAVLPEISWYLGESNGEVDQEFIQKIRGVESQSSKDGLLLDERRILGWMQFDYARSLAAGDEAGSRKQFDVANNTFLRAANGFMHSRRPGDACDVLLAGEAMDVYRVLYTSTNRRVPVKAADRYVANLATALVSIQSDANKIKAPDEQFAQLLLSTELATLILLQTGAADSGLRHAVLPVGPRAQAGTRPDAVIYPLVYDKFAEYDMSSPVTVTFVSGTEIEVLPRHINLGVGAVVRPNDPLGRLTDIAKRIAASSAKKPASKKDRKGASSSDHDFAADLSNAIFDAVDA